MIVRFNCENCGTEMMAYLEDEFWFDTSWCTCGKTYRVLKPSPIEIEEDINES